MSPTTYSRENEGQLKQIAGFPHNPRQVQYGHGNSLEDSEKLNIT